MKSLLYSFLTLLLSIAFFDVNAQDFKTGNMVFFRMQQQKVLELNGKIPRGIYKFDKKLYIVGTIVSQKKKYNLADVQVKYYLYTCSNTSETWIKTNKIQVQKRLKTDQLITTEVWDATESLKYQQNIYYLRPFTNEALEVLTRGNILQTTDSCPIIIAKNQKQ